MILNTLVQSTMYPMYVYMNKLYRSLAYCIMKIYLFLGYRPMSSLSIEEQRLMKSLERINDKLKGKLPSFSHKELPLAICAIKA